MSDLLPDMENLRKALGFVTAELKANPRAARAALIDEACQRFDLTPLEAESLWSHAGKALEPPA